MDNKIKYVDLNGLKTFAEALKQDLKNHVIELGLYQELLHRIENLELYKIVDLLPEKGDEDTIYLLKNTSGSGDKNVFIEYLYNNEYGWEEIGNFTPSIDLEDYLKIENAPFEKGEGENSAVLKGGNNQSISKNSITLGDENLSGLKGYYYKCIDFENLKIYLSKEQPTSFNSLINVSDLSNEDIEKDIEFNYQIGDVISIVNGPKYYDSAVITNILDGVVIVDAIPFDSYNDPEDTAFDDFSICCLTKPQIGLCDLGKFSIANGYGNQALFFASHSEGVDNKSIGHFSHTEGMSNTAYYAAHAEGWRNIAKGMCSHTEGFGNVANGKYSHVEGYTAITNGEYSHAEGHRTETIGHASHAEGNKSYSLGPHSHAEGNETRTEGSCAHAEGYKTQALGKYSHAEGNNTISKNEAEHACGKYNISNSDTRFSIGIGTSDTARKNAFEVKQNGDVYVTGIGGFTGENSSSSKSVQEVINELVNKLNEITTND